MDKIQHKKWSGTPLQTVLSLIGVISVSIFPCLFLFFHNAEEMKFAEILLPMGIFILLGAVIYGITALITRDAAKSGIIAMVLVLLLTNYRLMEKGIRFIFPNLRYWHILPALLLIFGLLLYLVTRKLSGELLGTVTSVLSIVFCALILINCVSSIPTLISKSGKDGEAQTESGVPVNTEKELPNFYYFLFDEYGSAPFMKKYYDMDLTPFEERLEKDHFSISHTGHNESIQTASIMTNVVSLDYVCSPATDTAEKDKLRENSAFFNLMRENGYNVWATEGAAFYNLPTPDGIDQTNSSATVDGKTPFDLILDNTAFYPLSKPTVEDDIRRDIDAALSLATSGKKNNMVMCHLNLPHEPFIYDRDGNRLKEGSSNWKDLHCYRDQHIFSTKLMDQIVQIILKNDPDSIIILQSDHCARASSDQDLFMKMFALEDMNNFFNAVYYRGQQINIEGKSSVNTLRTIMNELFDSQFEMLPVPVDTYKYR